MYAMSVTCTESSGKRAMAPHAASAACVEPSSERSSEKNKNENFQGQLQPQTPSRAMTSQAMSAACVDPCEKSTAVAGSYATKIATARRQPKPSGKTSGKQLRLPDKEFRGIGGEAWNSRACRHALTVAFELLRQRQPKRRPCTPSWSGRASSRETRALTFME